MKREGKGAGEGSLGAYWHPRGWKGNGVVRHLKFLWHNGGRSVPSSWCMIKDCSFVIPSLHNICYAHQSWDKKAPCRCDVTRVVRMVFLPRNEINHDSDAFTREIFVGRNCQHKALKINCSRISHVGNSTAVIGPR